MKTFPVLPPSPPGPEHLAAAGVAIPTAIPWAMIAPHAERAAANHGGHSLEQLAANGGLDAGEIVAILRNWAFQLMPPQAAFTQLNAEIERWLATTDVPGMEDAS